MKKLDFYWQTDDSWWHWEGVRQVVNDDAPEEAKKSYEHFKWQCENEDIS